MCSLRPMQCKDGGIRVGIFSTLMISGRLGAGRLELLPHTRQTAWCGQVESKQNNDMCKCKWSRSSSGGAGRLARNWVTTVPQPLRFSCPKRTVLPSPCQARMPRRRSQRLLLAKRPADLLTAPSLPAFVRSGCGERDDLWSLGYSYRWWLCESVLVWKVLCQPPLRTDHRTGFSLMGLAALRINAESVPSDLCVLVPVQVVVVDMFDVHVVNKYLHSCHCNPRYYLLHSSGSRREEKGNFHRLRRNRLADVANNRAIEARV